MSGGGDRAARAPEPDETRFSPAHQVAANVAREKRRTGLSLSQIADHAEVHRTHVSLILRGKRDIQVSTLLKLASAFGVKPSALLEGVEWEAGSIGLRGTFKCIGTTDRRSGIRDEATLS